MKDPELTHHYEIRDPKIEKLLGQIADVIGDALPAEYGFTLLMFPFSEKAGAPLFYISNADRTGVASVFREWLQKEAGNT